MLDSKGTEVKKGRFPTTCEGLDEFGSVVPEGVGMAIEASTSGIFVYEYLDGLLTGELCPGERDEGS